MSKKWLGVVSKLHVEKGVQGNFACVCHGKPGPISKLKAGDWLVYYSPTTNFPEGEKCQEFTGLGQVISGEVHPIEMGVDFKPYGIDMLYKKVNTVSIAELKHALSFTQLRSWGMRLRAGLIEITDEDFNLIQAAMLADNKSTV
ncbi:EVE domain-containing protein [Candidatus Aerophobetes bacterium]|uniref:UPF0310 protein COB21_01305 n=1 Tax=Aerophobetes bacterium TaxID=2030807 RepID=A0A2A4X6U1_UNCAE|nr:MAG: EVE domain-containing protein [Candidatus Aerophobetes bacterium]